MWSRDAVRMSAHQQSRTTRHQRILQLRPLLHRPLPCVISDWIIDLPLMSPNLSKNRPQKCFIPNQERKLKSLWKEVETLRQRPGVEGGLSAQRRRRLHALRSRNRHLGRDRGRASPALCRHDPRKGRPPSGRAAALLRPRPARAGRSSPLCLQDALHSRKAARPVRANGLAASCRPAPPHAPPAKDPRWISAPECAACGDRRKSPNEISWRSRRAALFASKSTA